MNRTLLVALALTACGPATPAPPVEVGASLSSAVLADDCPENDGLFDAARCEPGTPCPSFCQQTAVHIDLDAEGPGAALVELVEIRLVSVETGAVVDTLEAREALVFDGSSYVPVNSVYGPTSLTIFGGQSLDVRFETDAPDWNAIGGGDGWRTHSMSFRVEVVLRMNGPEEMIELEPVTRESEIVT